VAGGGCCKKRLRPNFGMPEKAAGAVGERRVVGFPPPLSSQQGGRGRRVAAPSLALGAGGSPHQRFAESRTKRVCAGGVMRAGGLGQPSVCSCHGSRANFPLVFSGPKAEVCTLFKQQHSSGLINY